jgi:nucleoside-diphosphate-sugar epimerase
MPSPSKQTILVTGANSFVAGHIIKLALEKGYHVRGTVRSEASTAKVRAKFADYGSKLSFGIVPDITWIELYEGAFASVAAPITGVINVAAPFALKVEDNGRDLLNPAIGGATAILEATKRYGPNVRRIVNTSSFASILDPSQGLRPGYTYTEKDWNPTTYEQAVVADAVTAYCASKALAEKAMWEWVETENPSFTLATINPPWVFGPHVGGLSDTAHLNESSQALFSLLDAEKVPPIDFAGFVDVRAVAAAHIAAFEKEEAAGQRFLVGAHFDYQSAVDAVRAEIPELHSRLPVGNPGAGQTEKVYEVDGSKAERIMGIKYIPLNESMKDSFAQLLEAEKRTAHLARRGEPRAVPGQAFHEEG